MRRRDMAMQVRVRRSRRPPLVLVVVLVVVLLLLVWLALQTLGGESSQHSAVAAFRML